MLFIIADPRPSGFLIDAETFVREARNKWPEESLEVIQSSDSLMSDVSIYIDLKNEPPFSVIHFYNNDLITCDGNLDNSIEVALWLRNLLSKETVMWLTDGHFGFHIALYPGMEKKDIMNNWVDHAEHDPYEEYPEYFGSD